MLLMLICMKCEYKTNGVDQTKKKNRPHEYAAQNFICVKTTLYYLTGKDIT